ncbi:MAG: PAS domain-containing protein, partial [Firmicutes bacterium]|nr:PAS domain-containing protein [Bacillota bacterium]
ANAMAFDRERELRAELEAVIQSSPEAILFLRAPDGQVLMANAAAATILGREVVYEARAKEHSRLYGIHKPTGEPLKPEEAPSFQALQGKIILGLEAVIRHASGREVPVLVNAAPVKDKEGNLIGAVVLFQDISRIRELEVQREELTAIVAHDLRAPLTVIVGYTDLLQRLERVRAHAAVHMGIAATPEEATRRSPGIPKLAFVCPPAPYRSTRGTVVEAGEVDLVGRILSMGRLHRAFALSGAACTAVAAQVEGTVVHEAVRAGLQDGRVRIGHPSGVLEVAASVGYRGGQWVVDKVTTYRTARRLMEGYALVPWSVWPA